MLAIPLPMVVSLLLVMLALSLMVQNPEQAKNGGLFLLLCALTTAVVGLRWTVDATILHFLAPILASLIPVAAWYCFSKAHHAKGLSRLHALGPILVTLAWFIHSWLPLLDIALTTLYLAYGLALLRSSLAKDELPEQVQLSAIEWARKSERIAGLMLLFSAMIDTSISLDFAWYQGQHARYILSLGHAFLLPMLSLAVVFVSLSTRASDQQTGAAVLKPSDLQSAAKDQNAPPLSQQQAQQIVQQLDQLMLNKQAFLDPDLTLDRLSRKLGIPARKISIAVNQIYGRNVSKVVNEYRITQAKNLMANSHDTLTQIYLNAGFQTKSNFNREFKRVTGQSPSQFRDSLNHAKP
ncbi:MULTISPECIES: helix-turn-helix domain-containing protein [unclassified Agarivorans]|uniref:helix-turn-helix domain-containing protein n=1 Tax=unclassified Agarivorans TaxID=2636026 RepID=UPI003D7E048C